MNYINIFSFIFILFNSALQLICDKRFKKIYRAHERDIKLLICNIEERIKAYKDLIYEQYTLKQTFQRVIIID